MVGSEKDRLRVERFDVIVVGSGAAGSFAALELGRHGLSVLVLEAGRAVGPQDVLGATGRRPPGIDLLGRARAALFGQPIQARVAFFNQRMVEYLVNDRRHRYGRAKDAPYLWFRGRQVGGRLHIFGRVLLRWSDAEFAPHAGGDADGWPIRYADLVPFYEQVERRLAIQGNADEVATMPDGIMSGPGRLTGAEQRFKHAVERNRPDRSVTSWRFALPDETPLPRALHDALATGHVTLRSDAVVTQLLTDPGTGRATGVRYVDRTTRRAVEVSAQAVVLGASPVESVRLLLHSRSARHPRGVGNSSGLLGHFFMDQPATLIFSRYKTPAGDIVEDVPVDERYGTTGGVYVPRQDDAAMRSRQVELGYSCQGSIGRQRHVRPGADLDATFMCFSEMQPRHHNRITLDPRRRDRWGVPLPHIDCRLGELERRALPRQAADMTEIIEGSGGSVFGWISPLGLQERGQGLYRELDPVSRWIVRRMLPHSLAVGAAIHESGGARMGTDPKSSILDSFNRVWDAPNVLVTDASAFASSGVMGTTLTVMALTVRACAQLAATLRAGDPDTPR